MISKNHPIIKNENTYFLDKKTITFHSEDRDIKKWSNSNFFEVSLPETLNNIQSMKLVSMELNDRLPVFSKNYRNIKLSFALDSYDETKKNNYETITIDEGNYSPELLALTIQNLMNTKITGKNFICKYNTITKKIWFGADVNFHLRFDIFHNYDDICDNEHGFKNNSHYWGLPYLLGYKKEIYNSKQSTNDKIFAYEHPTKWLSNGDFYVDAENADPISINGENCFYMEVDKYNIIDEIIPNSTEKNKIYNVNDGKVNSAFAQIPLKQNLYKKIFECKNNYNPPIKNISKLKFKFRFHDGKLVDFKNINFSFMIQFNSLLNEQKNSSFVRMGPIL